MSVIKRMKQIVDYKGISKRTFYKEVELSNGFLDKEREVGHKKMERICSIYPEINTEWLLTGKGKMLKNNIPSPNATQIHPEFVYVPLVSEFAQAGYLGGFGDIEYIETLPKIGFVINPQDRGNFLCFEVRGDSMDNDSRESLIERDIVLGREITSDLWSSKLMTATYIVVHRTEGILIKKLKIHDPKNGSIILESLNPFYEDLNINLKNVSQLFKTSTIIRKS